MEKAAMGILITRDAQTARSEWRVNLPPIAFGETTFAQCSAFRSRTTIGMVKTTNPF